MADNPLTITQLESLAVTPMQAMNEFYPSRPVEPTTEVEAARATRDLALAIFENAYTALPDTYVNRKGSEPPLRDLERILRKLRHKQSYHVYYRMCIEWFSTIQFEENYDHPKMAVIRHLFGLCKDATHDFESAVMLIAVTQDRLFESVNYTHTTTSLDEFIRRSGYRDIVTAVARNLEMLPTVVDKRNIPYVRKYLLCTGVELSELCLHADDPVQHYSMVFALARHKQEFNRNLVTDPVLVKGGVRFKVARGECKAFILDALKTSSFKDLDVEQIVKQARKWVDGTLTKFYYTDYNRKSIELDAPGFRALNSGLDLIRESIAMHNCLDDRVNEFWSTEEDWDYEDVHDLAYFHVDFEGCPKGITVSIRGPIGDADDYVLEQYHAHDNDDELLPRKSAVYAKIYGHINNVVSHRNKG